MKKLFIPLAVLGLGFIFAAPSNAADLSYERSTQLRRSGVIAPAGEDVLVQRRRIVRHGYRYGYGAYPAYRYSERYYGPRWRRDRYIERRGRSFIRDRDLRRDRLRDRDHLRDRDTIRGRDRDRDRDMTRDRAPDRDRAAPPADRGNPPPDRGTRPTDRTDQPGSIRNRDAAPRQEPSRTPNVRERDREGRQP